MKKVERKLRAGDTIWLETSKEAIFISPDYVESGMVSDYLMPTESLLSKEEAEVLLDGIDLLEYEEFYNVKL